MTLTTSTTPFYAGSSLTLTCTVTLDPHVDNDETVTISWSGPVEDRYIVTDASFSSSTYTSSLIISSLADQDDGIYTCTGMVTGHNEQQATASDSHTLSVTRKVLCQY